MPVLNFNEKRLFDQETRNLPQEANSQRYQAILSEKSIRFGAAFIPNNPNQAVDSKYLTQSYPASFSEREKQKCIQINKIQKNINGDHYNLSLAQLIKELPYTANQVRTRILQLRTDLGEANQSNPLAYTSIGGSLPVFKEYLSTTYHTFDAYIKALEADFEVYENKALPGQRLVIVNNWIDCAVLEAKKEYLPTQNISSPAEKDSSLEGKQQTLQNSLIKYLGTWAENGSFIEKDKAPEIQSLINSIIKAIHAPSHTAATREDATRKIAQANDDLAQLKILLPPSPSKAQISNPSNAAASPVDPSNNNSADATERTHKGPSPK